MSRTGYVPEEGLAGALALHLLGILRAHEGRYEQAEAAFLRAAEAEPQRAGSYVELGLVYACQEEYAGMVGALRRAVEVGAGGVRAYLAKRPLGDIPHAPVPEERRGGSGSSEVEEAASLIALAMAHLAAGRDEDAAQVLEAIPKQKPESSPAAEALLALSYLLCGEPVEATGEGVRCGVGRERG